MELCTTIPPRNDGTVTLSFPLGGGKKQLYVFTGEPLSCEVENAAHVKTMLATGNFLSRKDYEEEMDFRHRAAVRSARQKSAGQLQAAQESAALASGSFVPALGEGAPNPADEDEDGPIQDANAQPQEAGTRPTGRVNKANKG